APLFNFLAQPPQVFDGTIPVPAPVAPKRSPATPVASKPVVPPAKAPAVVAASGLLRQLGAARTALSNTRRRLARAVVRPRARSTKTDERVRVWMDLDELAISVVRTDGRPATAADAAEWMLRLNFL